MKEQVIIGSFKAAQKERLQNNQMIGSNVQQIQELQQLAAGMLDVMRHLPGYKEAIAEVTKLREERAAEAAKEMEVTEPETVEPNKDLDLGDE